ncbi:hypothetical protein FB45DRAFT_1001583 [Roridomyces roridus]|uniref:Spore coat protein U domain-containing protein n=1 Tax=Roridomyces roridus TaxID=1738132 RepID=A0AAD7FPZ4_9AGAR|nr:hypothetical protein FB45DRAFT_1001583 [Roridomyces roridus]
MLFHRFLISAAALAGLSTSLAASVPCSEAARFGILRLSQTEVAPGESFTITTDLTCSVQLGYTPTYLEYFIDGVSTSNIGGPIFLGRTTYDASTTPPQDQLSLSLPVWYYDPNATYSVRVDDYFAQDGPTGESVIRVGGVSTPIHIIGI